MAAVNFGYGDGTPMGWGQDIAASSDVEMAFGGASIAWDTVAALAAPLTLPEGTTYAVGEKVLLPGQVLVQITTGANIRMFGPFDPGVADGRQTVAAGVYCGLVRKPYLYQPTKKNRLYDSFIGLIVGGPVIWDMVRAHPTTANLANGPTWATLYAALPRVSYVRDLRASHT